MSDTVAGATSLQIDRIGNRFAQLLYEYFQEPGVVAAHGRDIWRQMRRSNGVIHVNGEHDKLCDSHAYCDANTFMLEAFEDVLGRESEVDDDDMVIMAHAWNKATKSYLCAVCEPTADNPILPDSPCCPGAFMKGGEDCVYCRNCKETC